MALWRIAFEGQIRWASGPTECGPEWLVPWGTGIDALLAGSAAAVKAALDGPLDRPVPPGPRILARVKRQEVWAGGVGWAHPSQARGAARMAVP